MSPQERVRSKMRNFGFVPKCYFPAEGRSWIMVYENAHGRDGGSSDRHFVGVFEDEVELYRRSFRTDVEARKNFEFRAEEMADSAESEGEDDADEASPA